MACWICTFGSACSSILLENAAIRYFQNFTNGLGLAIVSACLLASQLVCAARVPRRSPHRPPRPVAMNVLPSGSPPSCQVPTAPTRRPAEIQGCPGGVRPDPASGDPPHARSRTDMVLFHATRARARRLTHSSDAPPQRLLRRCAAHRAATITRSPDAPTRRLPDRHPRRVNGHPDRIPFLLQAAQAANTRTPGELIVVRSGMLPLELTISPLASDCPDASLDSSSMASIAATSPATLCSNSDNGNSSASQIAASSSLEASFCPRSTSER